MRDENFLVGERVRLTAVRTDDYDVITRQQEDAGFWRLMSSDASNPRTVEANQQYLDAQLGKPNAFYFAIRPVDDERFVGLINLSDIEWNHGVADLGMGIGREDWGKGYGTEALAILLRFAFHELNLHRVGLTVFDYNDRAVALYESAGFVKEGTDREFLNRDGRRFDMHRYGLLRSEWETSLSPEEPPGAS
jgi:RimJ/RimL family protein N-acetyltransferase